MTHYELYINDNLCDLPADEDITLKYQSGIFQELDIIQSNRSYNIDLPMTSRNEAIIENAQRLDVESMAPYRKLPAALYMDGVAVFTSGFAVITSISDTISVVLTWGNVDNFDPLFDAEMHDLADTLYDMGVGVIDWNENSQIVTGPAEGSSVPAMGFFGIDFGKGVKNPEYVHPSIMVQKVVEAIEQQHGITIDGKNRLSPNMLLPLVSHNGDVRVNTPIHTSNMDFSVDATKGSIYVGAFVIDSVDPAGILENVGTQPVILRVDGVESVDISLKGENEGTTFSIHLWFTSNASFSPQIRMSVIGTKEYDSTGYTVWSTPYTTGVRQSTSTEFVFTFSAANFSIDVAEYETIFFRVDVAGEDSEQVSFLNYSRGFTGELTLTGDFPNMKVIYPDPYPIGVNLPDMTQGDFLSSLLALNGLFPYADKDQPDTIRVMSADDLFKNLQDGNFVDWSRKVLLNDARRIEIPESSEFEAEGYAQSNTLDYDNDDEVLTDTAGEIIIDNVNLEKEGELADLPFSATDNTDFIITSLDGEYSTRIARIPIYQPKDEADPNSEVEYKELSPRILDYKIDLSPTSDTIPCVYGIFNESQRFVGENGIIARKYSGLSKIVQHFRMITVRARLSALDLAELRFDVPVYIAQFGCFFAIYSIETSSNDICDCQLVHLPDEGITDVFEISSPSVVFNYQGGSAEVFVQTSEPVTITTSASWIQATPAALNGAGNVQVIVSPNLTGQERTGAVTYTNASGNSIQQGVGQSIAPYTLIDVPVESQLTAPAGSSTGYLVWETNVNRLSWSAKREAANYNTSNFKVYAVAPQGEEGAIELTNGALIPNKPAGKIRVYMYPRYSANLFAIQVKWTFTMSASADSNMSVTQTVTQAANA